MYNVRVPGMFNICCLANGRFLFLVLGGRRLIERQCFRWFACCCVCTFRSCYSSSTKVILVLSLYYSIVSYTLQVGSSITGAILSISRSCCNSRPILHLRGLQQQQSNSKNSSTMSGVPSHHNSKPQSMDKFQRYEAWLRENGANFDMVSQAFTPLQSTLR